MAQPDQLDIKQMRGGKWTITFPFHEEFITWLKGRVPYQQRSYDGESKTWTIWGPDVDKLVNAICGIAVQKFQHVMRIYWKDGEQIWRNEKTGSEYVQKNLF